MMPGHYVTYLDCDAIYLGNNKIRFLGDPSIEMEVEESKLTLRDMGIPPRKSLALRILES